MYLLPSSCHPPHQHQNIPLSLALRINRVCSLSEDRETRFQELREYLINRNHQPGIVDGAIRKARDIPRNIALRKMVKPPHSKRPVSVVSWDPRLPSIDTIQLKHWCAMNSLTWGKFSQKLPWWPIRNIREYLIRAKLPPPNQIRQKRRLLCMKKCKKKNCLIFPYVLEGKEVKSKHFKWRIEADVSCEKTNIVYMLNCMKRIGRQEKDM